MKKIIFSKPYIVILLFISIFILLLHNIIKNDGLSPVLKTHWQESSNTYNDVTSEVNVRQMPPSIAGTVDGESTALDSKGLNNFTICSKGNCEIHYPFYKGQVIKKISIYFPGEPISDPNIITLKLNEKRLNESSVLHECSEDFYVCNYYFSSTQLSKLVSIFFYDPKERNSGVYDIKFFEATPNDIVSSIFNFIFKWPRSIGTYITYPLLFSILYLGPGFLIADYFKKSRKMNLLEIILVSTVILSILSLINFILPPVAVKSITLAILIVFIFKILSNSSYVLTIIVKERTILLIYIVSILFLSGIMYIRDFPKTLSMSVPIVMRDFYAQNSLPDVTSYATYETDFIIPYQTAISFAKGGKALQEKIGVIYNVADRTPLISFLLLLYTKVFGQTMFVYQIFTVILANLFIIAFYFLSKNYVDEIKSTAIALLLLFSHFFTFITLYWPQKTITLFFVFASLYYITKNRPNYLIGGITMLLAFLLHMFILVYYLPFSLFVLIHSYLRSRLIGDTLRSFFAYSLPLVVGFAVWTIFSFAIGQNHSIIWSILTQKTWTAASESINTASYREVGPGFILTSQFWKDKFFNFIDLFVYYNHNNQSTRLFDFYKLTFPGSLGAIVTVSFFLVLIKIVILNRRLIKLIIFTSFFLIVLPIFLTVATHGFYIRTGLMSYLLALIPLIILFVSAFIRTRYFIVLTLLSVCEYIFIYFMRDDLTKLRLSFFYEDTNKFFTILLISIITFCIFTLYSVSKRNSFKL